MSDNGDCKLICIDRQRLGLTAEASEPAKKEFPFLPDKFA